MARHLCRGCAEKVGDARFSLSQGRLTGFRRLKIGVSQFSARHQCRATMYRVTSVINDVCNRTRRQEPIAVKVDIGAGIGRVEIISRDWNVEF